MTQFLGSRVTLSLLCPNLLVASHSRLLLEMASCCLDTPQIPPCCLGQFLPRTPTPSPRGKRVRVQLVWFLLCSRLTCLTSRHARFAVFCNSVPQLQKNRKKKRGGGWGVEGKGSVHSEAEFTSVQTGHLERSRAKWKKGRNPLERQKSKMETCEAGPTKGRAASN